MAALLALVLLLLALLGLELPADQLARRSGRQLESRLRQAFLRKIPRLGDRYFHSRPISDMAERGHSVHQVRSLPSLGHQLVRGLAELGLTTLALLWLAPHLAPLLLALAVLSVLLPAGHQVLLAELDLRARTHRGAIGRFYLDVLLGAVPVRAHRAETAVRRGHEDLLTEVGRSGLQLHRATLGGLAVQGILTHVLAAAVVFLHLESGASSLLLLVYWTLKLPPLGQQLAMMARQVPGLRNVTARLLEPLGAVEDPGVEAPGDESELAADGVGLRFEGVAVQLAGHEVLAGLDLEITAGEHVAVVGPSGAGKSTLLGLLLGWHRPCRGEVWVEGSRPLAEVLGHLRRQTAWVDPSVQLWNRSFLANLRYGAEERGAADLGGVLADAALLEVVETLPEGLQSPVGESGKRLSGGEGQRLRLGRGMARPGVRLAIFDEPFRGLERDRRLRLLAAARRRFRRATLLIVTHEIEDALELDRVLVIEGGRLVENGNPRELAERQGSRFGALLEARREVRRAAFQEIPWRRLHLEDGRLEEKA
jgi:ATP-binding cassette subfamily B protein